jgi:cytochrome bd-type quinol oxidase subunit 2
MSRLDDSVEQKHRHLSRWLALVTIPVVASVVYAVALTGEVECSGQHRGPIQLFWPLVGISAAVAVALAARARERVAVVVVRAVVTVLLTLGSLFVVGIYWAAAHGCFS